MPGVEVWPQSQIAERLAGDYLDLRMAALSGTRLSGAAALETARALGGLHVPPCVSPRIKAIAVDLDNTLYQGVLGEDGISGVVVSPGHIALQTRLAELRKEGIFLAMVSKNEPADVEKLFREHPGFVLKSDDFSASSVSWNAKSEGLRTIARQLRISPDAILFLDDNPGELAEVSTHLPEMPILHVSSPEDAISALKWYPRLNGYAAGEADAVRVKDLDAANLRVEEMAKATDPIEYLRALEVRLEFEMNPLQHTGRLQELSVKTNQFNTALLRLPLAEVQSRLKDPGRCSVTVRLVDRLSDSGIVAGLFSTIRDRTLVIDEITISCRALGRNVEDIMIAESMREILRRHAARGVQLDNVEFAFEEGPRNQPARSWLTRYTGQDPTEKRPTVTAARVLEEGMSLPVELQWSGQ
jgi:FkbH-like protein